MNKPARKTLRIDISVSREFWDAFVEGTGYTEARIRNEVAESHKETGDYIRTILPESDPKIEVKFL